MDEPEEDPKDLGNNINGMIKNYEQKILIVDDEPFNVLGLQLMME